MKQIDLTNVQETGDFKRPAPGPYICTIQNVEDVTAKEYLKITYDITEGEFAGYYSEMRANHPDWTWAGTYVRSYKQTALGMLKRFCSAVSKSNGNYVFDANTVNSDEKTLAGKKIGIIFREEEYYGNDGEKKTRLSVYGEFPVSELANQVVPKKKELPPDGNDLANAGTAADVDEIPF